MLQHTAILKFAHAQKTLLRSTYDAAWNQGVNGYQPDPNPPQQQTATNRDAALAGLTGAALLAARRELPYLAPASPDPVRRAVALAPAFTSLNSMTGQLARLGPTADQIGALTSAGISQAYGADALGAALKDWVLGNSYRLDNGDSVAWAGESAGYAEAADADGQLLEWQDSGGDESECSDCETLASMPPQPLADWPSQPGDGATACNVGCRCELGVSDISIVPGDTYTPDLTDAQQATVSGLMDAQQNALASMMADAQYLD